MTPLASLRRDRAHAVRVVRETGRVLREGTGTAVVLCLITGGVLGVLEGVSWGLAGVPGSASETAARGLVAALTVLGPGLLYLAALAAFLGVTEAAPGLRAAFERLRRGLVLALAATFVVVVGAAVVAWSLEATRIVIARVQGAVAPGPAPHEIVGVGGFLFVFAWITGVVLPLWIARRLSKSDVAPSFHLATTARVLLLATQVALGVLLSRGAFGQAVHGDVRLVVAAAAAVFLDAAVTAAVVAIARAPAAPA